MSMKIQIVGDGIKECALARNLEKYGGHDVIVTPGNEGTKQLISDFEIDLPGGFQFDDILEAARIFRPDRVIFMDERIALSNLKNLLEEEEFEVFGPSQEAAELLYDKAQWTSFFETHGLDCPQTLSFRSLEEAMARIEQTDGPVVLKERGRKGRFCVPYSMEEAAECLNDWFETRPDENAEVLISPFYGGIRFNVPVLVWNDQVLPFDSMITQRGIYEEEDDAEMKGMGALAPAVGIIDEEIYRQAVLESLVPFFIAMNQEGIPYQGFADGEFILNEEGLKLVNMKCGLAECGLCCILQRSRDDLAEVIDRLKNEEIISLHFAPLTAVTVMLAAKDYPEGAGNGLPILIDEDQEGEVYPYHARSEDGQLVSHGGRVIAAAATGKDLQEASEKALEAASHIHCDDLFYRSDIGNPKFFEKLKSDKN